MEFGIGSFSVPLFYSFAFSLTPLYFLLYLVHLSLWLPHSWRSKANRFSSTIFTRCVTKAMREPVLFVCIKIVLQEIALVKGCEHAYGVTCILWWATCREKVTCPQCKQPSEFFNIHFVLDGSIQGYMFEESVCLLLQA